MAKVSIHDLSSLISFPFEKCASKVHSDATVKRKTPSELREEQLKRRRCARPSDESSASLLCFDSTGGAVHGVKKVESSKIPKYIDTRVDEVYPVKKSSDMFRLLYGKEKAKDTFSTGQANDLTSLSAACSLATKSQPLLSCETGKTANVSDHVSSSAKDTVEQGSVQVEKCNQNTFRNVAELSLGGKTSSGPATIDMDKALKGLIARELPPVSSFLSDSSGRIGDLPSISPKSFCSSLHIPGNRPPLDFTLKSIMRLVSSSSMSWFHRLTVTSGYEGMTLVMAQFGHARDQTIEGGRSSCFTGKAVVLNSKALHSWSYPQSSLLSSVVSAMLLSAARGGSTEIDFLSKRQLAWEDSFRSLYYLLRRNMCNIFYLYTSHFVVMFTGGNFGGKMYSCNAYLSQSTRGLRSLLREHDVQFSMPLCHSNIEQVTADDLLELSEFEKKNPGQTHHLDFMSHVDNSSQSLLAFVGNENVHGLYDFLLNYRSFLHFLINVDVPALYSPVPFQNASLCMPEVRCKQMKRADSMFHAPRGSHVDNGEVSSSGICYSVEIKDTILPPWIVSRICMAMGSEVGSFEASFTTDPLSIGLNFALNSVCGKAAPLTESRGQESPQNGSALGIPDAIFDSRLQSASLNSLKFSKGSYVAHLSPVG